MKFCPTCKTRFDEEILRFCTKDGTPLVEEGQPNFTALPSESNSDDLGEETVIRRKTPPKAPPSAEPLPDFDGEERVSSPRIVIPMTGETEEPELPRREGVRAMTTESIRRQPPPKSNTAMVVFLTVLGTLVVIAGAGGVFWMLNNQDDDNRNVNYNTNFNSLDINLNTNLPIANSLANIGANANSNQNTNANSNVNANSNSNANLKTPTPTVTPSRTPTATPTPVEDENDNTEINTNANISLPTGRPAQSPTTTPRISPTATPDAPANRPVNAGILNSRAVNLPKPAYPQTAKQMGADGQVAVQVTVDEFGNVVSAKATTGNALLRAPAEAAARQSKFNPIKVRDQAVKASGFVIYNFVN